LLSDNIRSSLRLRLQLSAVLASLAVVSSCASLSSPRELHGEGLGSTWSVTLAGPMPRDLGTIGRGVQERLDSLARQLSRWDPTSALSQINASPGEDWQSLPPELFTALSHALALAANTGGAYDPTVAPLVDVWGFGTRGRRYEPPPPADIAIARARVGWAKVELDAANHRMRRPAGTQIDLSSLTHGFAADQVATYLRSAGVQNYLIDVGSEIRASGNSPEGHPWRVAIEQPPPETDDDVAHGDAAAGPSAPLRVLALRDAGVATSGNYRYYFDYDGRRYSHRLDPRTGEPIAHPLASVTVIASECMHADALATALTVLGPEAGYEYAETHAIAALFVLRTASGLAERMTPRFVRYLL
jgi:thiamine biosynthesis lipoprotein